MTPQSNPHIGANTQFEGTIPERGDLFQKFVKIFMRWAILVLRMTFDSGITF